MIVDPDFLDHWKTRMLVDMLDDDRAPLYVIRLWAHCQNRRDWVFDDVPPVGVKAICRYDGEAEILEDALTKCGFLSRDGDTLTIVGWDEHNATLIANWKNGLRGGRPKGSGKETHEKPMGSTGDNPSGTDKIGLDRIGCDKALSSDKSERIPYDEIFRLWNEILPELPQPRNKTDTRKRNIKARWHETAQVPTEDGFQDMPCSSLDFWERFFRRIRNQPFLMGEGPRGWQASIDSVTKKEQFYKIIEGSYLNEN